MEALTLSVVLPVYNEEEVIEGLIVALEQEVVKPLRSVEVIVVDDRSTDRSPEILDGLAAQRPWLRVRHAPANAGHGPSVLEGLGLARGEWIFQLDSDGQFLVSEFDDLWARRDGADLVLGVRATRRDPAHRLLLSRLVGGAVSILARRRVRDANTPFRLLRRSLWEDLRPRIGPTALAPSILVTVGALLRGWRVVEIPVTHLPRASGGSTLRSWRLLVFSLRGLSELARFRARVAR